MANTSFASLKRGSKNNIQKIQQEVNKMKNNNQGSVDNRFWYPEVDKVGNGYAVLRFLPAPKGEDVPFVRLWEHSFKGPGGWYMEKSLSTIGLPDPLAELNAKLWNSGIDANKEIVRKQKRQLRFITNLDLIKDQTNPENEGKNYLFKFGKKIFDKLNDVMNPEFEDEAPINPFDFWEGATFKLKIRNVEGYRNYDKSEFDKPSAYLDGDDAKLETLWNKEYSLQEFINPKSFKSYEELRARLEKVLGTSPDKTVGASSVQEAMKTAEELTAADVIGSDEDADSLRERLRKIAEED